MAVAAIVVKMVKVVKVVKVNKVVKVVKVVKAVKVFKWLAGAATVFAMTIPSCGKTGRRTAEDNCTQNKFYLVVASSMMSV